jgi:hypothetical protein
MPDTQCSITKANGSQSIAGKDPGTFGLSKTPEPIGTSVFGASLCRILTAKVLIESVSESGSPLRIPSLALPRDWDPARRQAAPSAQTEFRSYEFSSVPPAANHPGCGLVRVGTSNRTFPDNLEQRRGPRID